MNSSRLSFLMRLSAMLFKVSCSLNFSIHVAVILLLCFNLKGPQLLGSAALVINGNETDRQALLEFKAKITGDQLGIMRSWNNSVHFCQWHGVKCGRRHQRVTELDLRALKLMGSISPSIGNLSFLRLLNLENNSFSQELPQEIGRLHGLEELILTRNFIRGEIPSNISGCSKLTHLYIGHNLLVGEIPAALGRLSNLKELSFSNNTLRGSILPLLGNLTSLEIIYLSRNRFTGVIPEVLGKLKNLTLLSMAANAMSGIVPSSLFNLSNIRILDIGVNNFHDSLPSKLGVNMPYLERFLASLNQLSGPFPLSIANASNLIKLQIEGNKFTGNMPSFEKLEKLQGLNIVNNLLGSRGANDLNFLCSLTNATSLDYLELSNNRFGGVLPECISNLSTTITIFLVQGNNIVGRIPAGFGNLINLEMLVATQNHLSGSIPSVIGRLEKLHIFSVDINYVSGAIPTSLGNLKQLSELYLNDNNLQGEIPPSLGKCENLVLLALSNNNLSGSIPFEIARLSSLSIGLYLSSNHLTGMLPFEVGNLRNLGTLDVSQNMLSGTGSFGLVYKGILEEDGKIIAVKVLKLLSRRASRSFLAECEALRNVRHRNLVKVLTACSGVNYHGNDFKALVYEFMANRSLEDWLHPPVGMNEAEEAPKILNFFQRLNVAIDVGCALEYLHHYCETPIVHCDLKPSNVLLDAEMVGHVGDFGLAKFIASDLQNNTSSQSSSLGLRGTIGYAPPEYGLGSDVTTNGDVYSYGIRLLEMFTGKRPTDELFKENLNLHNFVKTALPNRVGEITDPILLQESFTFNDRSQNDNRLLWSLNYIYEIGVACSVEFQTERMNMVNVVAELCYIKNKLLPTRSLRTRGTG
ncbi:hypothetical protein REPUB_Repub04eG0077100 [Reevesia pubescens]